jgi:phenylacetate-coenzyme A ligase PaaK-like adenylate-forming protein
MQNLRRKELLDKIKKADAYNFDDICLELFRYQIQNNQLYADFVQLLGIRHKDITIPQQIPFLPISFFKTKNVKSENWQEETVFKSSGTTGMSQSLHFVRDKNFYLKNCEQGFSKFYGNPSDYAVLALLPSYLERDGSSLILMAEYFISLSKYPQSGFFLYDMEQLKKRLMECMAQHIPVLLLGVSFALLDFAEYCSMPLNNVIVMETGGMKGRRKELLREELHTILKEAFKIDMIHSEYGMTELMSQAYSKGNGIFYTSDTLRVFIRDSSDPLCILPAGKSGAVSLVDLANIDTCAFIATDDIGKVHNDGSFEILGRFDASDIRGCNLLIG